MRHAIKSALSVLFLAALVAAPAIAKDHGRGHEQDDDRSGYHDRDHDRDDDRYEDRRRGKGRSERYRDDRYYRSAPVRVVYRPVYRPGYRQVYRPAYRPGYGQPRWARGDRYYDHGYAPTYVIQDYRGYGLRAPPRGYHWRRSAAGDYLLVAIATGVITDLIFGN